MRYFDTSVVISLYVNDVHSQYADLELRKNPKDIIISLWVNVEFKSALGLLVRRQIITQQLAHSIFNRFQVDQTQGKYLIQTIKPSHYQAAENSLQFHNNLRAADALHLGIVLHEGYELVTADRTLSEVARAIPITTALIS